jgi:hypothetical protein
MDEIFSPIVLLGSPVVLLGMFCVAILREVLEFDTLFKHRSTPGRLVSSATGIFVFFLILDNKWRDATEATFIYFCLDIMYTFRFSWTNSISSSSILLHHILGFTLCAYSLVHQTYDTSHFGYQLTRALLVLEVCNPVLHLSFINQNEEIFTNWIKTVIDCAMLVNYFYIRVWCLGSVVFQPNEKLTVYPQSNFYSLTVILWCLQVLWFFFLLHRALGDASQKSTRKELGNSTIPERGDDFEDHLKDHLKDHLDQEKNENSEVSLNLKTKKDH